MLDVSLPRTVATRYVVAVSSKLPMSPFLVRAFDELMRTRKLDVLDGLLGEHAARSIARAVLAGDPQASATRTGAKTRAEIVALYDRGEARGFEDVLDRPLLSKHMAEVLRAAKIQGSLDPIVFYPELVDGILSVRFRLWGGKVGGSIKSEGMQPVMVGRVLGGQMQFKKSEERDRNGDMRDAYEMRMSWVVPLAELVNRMFGPLIEARIREAFVNERAPV
jgi:hypothetical protein